MGWERCIGDRLIVCSTRGCVTDDTTDGAGAQADIGAVNPLPQLLAIACVETVRLNPTITAQLCSKYFILSTLYQTDGLMPHVMIVPDWRGIYN